MAGTDEGQGTFTDALAANKAEFLSALRSDDNLKPWVVVMGNEAGDLDSIASAIAFAYLAERAFPNYRYLPLYQAASADVALRPENELAFEDSHINIHRDILFLDDLNCSSSDLASLASERGLRYALVDHNKLGPSFGDKDDSVLAIIDHHQDEGHHKAAIPRKIQVPTGSCSALVTEYFTAEAGVATLPQPIADLLLSALVIDTGGLKPAPKGKAVDTDLKAADFLVSQSSLAPSSTKKSDFSASTSSKKIKDLLKERTDRLAAKKFDLSKLGSRDLLRRDYKEYESDVRHYRYGLSTVPVALSDWLERDEIAGSWDTLLDKCEAWGEERHLDIVGVLTSYISGGKKVKKADNGGKGRELVFLLRGDADKVDKLKGLFASVEKDEILNVGPLEIGNPVFSGDRWSARVVTYQQRNAEATRKQVAPAMKKAIEEVEG